MSGDTESASKAEPRFFDSRAAYMMFVTTTTEKAAVAARIARELPSLGPGADAFRVFDAGMGDASVLTNVMRNMHESFTHVPWPRPGSGHRDHPQRMA